MKPFTSMPRANLMLYITLTFCLLFPKRFKTGLNHHEAALYTVLAFFEAQKNSNAAQ